MADFIMKALHQDDIEHTICGAVPPCISLFAAVIEKINVSEEEISKRLRFQVAAGPQVAKMQRQGKTKLDRRLNMLLKKILISSQQYNDCL